MSIIEKLRTHIITCPELSALAPVHVDGVRPEPTNYSIETVPGDIVREEYMDGSSTRVFPFAFTLLDFTPEDIDKLAVSGFFERFADWIGDEDNLPELDTGQQAEHLRALNWPFLMEEDSGHNTGTYQMQCELQYFQEG